MTLLRKRFLLPALAALAVLCGLAVWMLTPSDYLAIDLRTCIHKRLRRVWAWEIIMTASAEEVSIS